ncbi:MAG: hypothetical protein LBI34_00850 [Puniceicoccales bacterium]|jgi:hypothetical protein|nr:hypothetical protein [Puniceicoccales bacterium]
MGNALARDFQWVVWGNIMDAVGQPRGSVAEKFFDGFVEEICKLDIRVTSHVVHKFLSARLKLDFGFDDDRAACFIAGCFFINYDGNCRNNWIPFFCACDTYRQSRNGEDLQRVRNLFNACFRDKIEGLPASMDRNDSND